MKRYARLAGAVVAAGALSWVVVSNGPVQAGSPPDDHDHDHGSNGTGSTVPLPDERDGSELFLPDGDEGPPGSKFRIGGRDCVEDFATVAEVSVVHENGTRIPVADGVTDAEGNWEVTAVIPEDMEDGDLSIDAACFPDLDEHGVVGFAQASPIFSYASATFGVRAPDVPEDPTTTEPEREGDGGGDGDGDAGGEDGGTASESQTDEPAPAVNGSADFTG